MPSRFSLVQAPATEVEEAAATWRVKALTHVHLVDVHSLHLGQVLCWAESITKRAARTSKTIEAWKVW